MNNSPSTPKMLLSAREAAEALSICEKSLWTRTQPRGDLPCVRIGTRVLYHIADLTAWIEAQKEGGRDAQDS